MVEPQRAFRALSLGTRLAPAYHPEDSVRATRTGRLAAPAAAETQRRNGRQDGDRPK
jgi:hypothetical protein